MKKHPPTVFSLEIWKEIERIFWRHDLPCLPDASCDGLDSIEIETTKRGVEIHGGIWFLTGGNPTSNPRFDLNLCLARPQFSSIESVTVDKLRTAKIADSVLDGGVLSVTVT